MIQNIESENDEVHIFNIVLQGEFFIGVGIFFICVIRIQVRGGVEINGIFSLKWRYYGPNGIFWNIYK